MSFADIVSFAGFLALVCAAGLSGVIFKPGAWYRRLDKPAWTPPNWAFPVVWSALYLMIAVAGWRVYETAGLAALPFVFYAVQLVLNAAWSPLFFGMHRPDLAFVDITLLAMAVAANIALFWSIDAVAGLLLVPYLIWVCIAAGLNLSVWRRNPGAFSHA